ncbi:unnamed protein product [Boreogadus saida]
MLLLSRAAWSSLCLAVVAMAAELTQDQVSWTRREGENVTFRCTNTDQCSYYIFWYQKKESETFTLILIIDKSNGYFTVGVHIFGRGTTLVVTERSLVRPKVSVYPATGADLKGRRSLLCVARDMVPEEVRFSWRRRGGGGGGGKDGEQLELRGPTYAASILVIDQRETLTDPYICSVEHESDLKEEEHESDLKEEIPAGAVQSQAGVCALHSDGGEECALLLWPGSPAPPHQQDQQDAQPAHPEPAPPQPWTDAAVPQNQHHHSPGLTLLSPRTSRPTSHNHTRSSCHHVNMSTFF